jgi:hypothetical protein
MRRPRRRDAVTGVTTSAHRRNDRRPAMSGSVVLCVSGKTGFTRTDAERKVEEYAAVSNRKRRVSRAYPCSICDHWHLTSEAARG